MKHSVTAAILALAAAGVSAYGAQGNPENQHLQKGDYVAVIGDSITEQKLYSVYIEDYLLMCKPAPDLTITQFGWSGETSWGFAGRMHNDMISFGANVATTNFGMNDGGYSPENPQKEKQYHDAYTDVVEQLKKGGVRFIVVGSPGAVDTWSFGKDQKNPKPVSERSVMYNKTLGTERDLARKVAREQGVVFADVFDPMMQVMEKAKAKYGPQYTVAGGDGVHPGPNGHLVMAYAYLKALGCDGNIGTITVDLAGNKATGSEGHKILSDNNGSVEIESARYPFCFFGDPKSTNATSGIIEFFPFNQDLNRFTLIVSDAQAGKQYKVTWGDASKTFPGDALSKGINLAAEFVTNNPFAQTFAKVDKKVRQQQDFETPLVKHFIHDLPGYEQALPDEKQAFGKILPALVAKDKPLREGSAAAVTPVKHTIRVEEEK
ncbi:MAG TPA: SGNH/GDSL hydrolase family protein [Tepidisphaeraceae bacterium]|nr:SGNH/GDSL hydrolase family protein [Tepidisphaeraceae bacterium]